MKLLKNGLSIRGDNYYCPLSFQLDTYWNCENACHHCYLRRLNRTWGDDLRPLDIDIFRNKIKNGLKNKNPKSPLAMALSKKKTIRLGNKSDPYQSAELIYGVTRKVIRILLRYDWSFVIQTKYTENIFRDLDILEKKKHLVTIMPIVSPGLERDWEILEKKGTTHPIERIKHAKEFQRRGFNVGINGEPYIGGFHTISDFERTIILLKKHGIKSYNTYNLHFNDWVAKNFHSIGIDIEEVWRQNQDSEWKKTLVKLISIAKDYGIILGCPDFVNSGNYIERSNTCCGIDVPNPCTFTVMNWKRMKMQGYSDEEILERSWDGIGDYEFGSALLSGEKSEFYSLGDIIYDEK